ncbi:MAG: PAS domain S-box protein, partial [Proteobacteria bacterium]|nr:PAS domain S-box protein [Pseudomonadota bacterium]
MKETVIGVGIARACRALMRSVSDMTSSATRITEPFDTAAADGRSASDRIDAARVALQYRLGRLAYLAAPIYAGLLLYLLWRPAWEAALVAWFGVLMLVTLCRMGVHWAYNRRAKNDPWPVWERRYVIGTFAAGAVWAAAPVLFFAVEEPVLQLAVIFIVGGSVVLATGVHAPSTAALYAYILLPLTTLSVQLALQPGGPYTTLAIALALLGVVLVRVQRDVRHAIVNALRLRNENAMLLRRAEASEAWLRDAIESIPDGVAVFDENDQLLACNDAYATLYGGGRAREALLQRPYREFASAAFDAELQATEFAGGREAWIAARLAERQRADGELVQMRARDGRWLQRREMRSKRGGWLSLFTDVSALKGAHERYVALLAEADAVLDTLPVGVAFVENGRITRCNRRLESMLGHAPGTLRDRTTRVWYGSDAEWEERWRSVEAQLAAGGVVESELELARGDGSRLGCHLLGRLLDPGALHGAAILTFTDVDDRLAALNALRRSERTYRDLVETSNDLIWSVDLEGRWTYLNAAAVRQIYGCDPGDLLGRPFADILSPAVRERDLAVFRRLLEGEPVFNYETRHVRRDGSLVDLSFNAIALRDARGAVAGTT